MIELLAPAGGMPQLRAALRYGADAVYGGAERFGLRAFAGNFSMEELAEGVRLCHENGRKFYITLNILPFDEDLAELIATAGQALERGVDGAIALRIRIFNGLRLIQEDVIEAEVLQVTHILQDGTVGRNDDIMQVKGVHMFIAISPIDR